MRRGPKTRQITPRHRAQRQTQRKENPCPIPNFEIEKPICTSPSSLAAWPFFLRVRSFFFPRCASFLSCAFRCAPRVGKPFPHAYPTAVWGAFPHETCAKCHPSSVPVPGATFPGKKDSLSPNGTFLPRSIGHAPQARPSRFAPCKSPKKTG